VRRPPSFEGKKHSEETRATISAKLKGREFTQEHRAKLSAARKKRQPPSEETRAKMSATMKATLAQKRALGQRPTPPAWKGTKRPPEVGAKISAALKGKPQPWNFKEGANPHAWLLRWYPKTGICEECGAEPGPKGWHGTDYAFRYHPKPHTRNREDYRELCRKCHSQFDLWLRRLTPSDRASRIVKIDA
jgi:hypothetical protein